MRDAFISWDESFTLDISIRYWEKARKAGIPVPADFGEFWRQIEWTGMQRHLKILGIFARLQYRDNKPKYLADTPRFIAYVRHVAYRYEQLKPILSSSTDSKDRANPKDGLLMQSVRGSDSRSRAGEAHAPALRLHSEAASPVPWKADDRLADRRAHPGRSPGFVVNTAHLADQFPAQLGDGHERGITIRYSKEGDSEEEALETLGGIAKALPLLSPDGVTPFIVAAGDIVTEFDYSRLPRG